MHVQPVIHCVICAFRKSRAANLQQASSAVGIPLLKLLNRRFTIRSERVEGPPRSVTMPDKAVYILSHKRQSRSFQPYLTVVKWIRRSYDPLNVFHNAPLLFYAGITFLYKKRFPTFSYFHIFTVWNQLSFSTKIQVYFKKFVLNAQINPYIYGTSTKNQVQYFVPDIFCAWFIMCLIYYVPDIFCACFIMCLIYFVPDLFCAWFFCAWFYTTIITREADHRTSGSGRNLNISPRCGLWPPRPFVWRVVIP